MITDHNSSQSLVAHSAAPDQLPEDVSWTVLNPRKWQKSPLSNLHKLCDVPRPAPPAPTHRLLQPQLLHPLQHAQQSFSRRGWLLGSNTEAVARTRMGP